MAITSSASGRIAMHGRADAGKRFFTLLLLGAASLAVAAGCGSTHGATGAGGGGGAGGGDGGGAGGGDGGMPADPCAVLTGPADDRDEDGVLAGKDNCACVANPNQADPDTDQIGSACDNCPNVANYDQADVDHDGHGDACEDPISSVQDYDEDGIADTYDNCWLDANPGQEDSDGDLAGNACDNCPGISNHDQADADHDGVGDACDGPSFEDGDGDGVPNEIDNCPEAANPAGANGMQADADKDGVGDACDNCLGVPNHDQVDTAPANGVGDVCEGSTGGIADVDDDGVPDLNDNCPQDANAGQTDTDTDGRGDACDNCVSVKNPYQEDSDMDGTGDHCEGALDLPPSEPACEDASLTSALVEPNVYFLIDISGSMDFSAGNDLGTRWEELTSALGTISGSLVGQFNLGMGVFPARQEHCLRYWSGGGCRTWADKCHGNWLPDEILDMAQGYTAADFEDAYAGIDPDEGTPTSTALRRLREQALYRLNTSDPYESIRPKVVVLITDGDPNSADDACDNTGALTETVDEARTLYDNDVPVYVLGFDGINEANMQAIATAGRGFASNDPTQRWYKVSSADSIVMALEDISSSIVSCSLVLEDDGDGSTAPDYGRVAVAMTIGGTRTVVPRDATNGWALVTGSPNHIELRGTSCDQLTSAAANGQMVSVDVKVACVGECPGDAEVCDDHVDNDCNGQTDEGCSDTCWCEMDPVPDACTPILASGCPDTACTPSLEVCNGVDDDCDMTTDEGCCVPSAEVCGDGRDNNCDGVVDEGCMCYPEVCDGVDNDCDGASDEGCPIIIQ